MSSLSQYLSIAKLLRNDDVSQLGMGINAATRLYSDTKREKVFDEKKTMKKIKIAKESHAYKCYASTYNVDTLNSSNSQLHLKHTEFAIKDKLKDLLPELKGFKFVERLVLRF